MYDQDQNDNFEKIQQTQQMEDRVKQYLDKGALQRYSNIKLVNKEKSLQIITLLYQFISTGQIKEKLTDEQFKNLLMHLNQDKKFNIIK